MSFSSRPGTSATTRISFSFSEISTFGQVPLRPHAAKHRRRFEAAEDLVEQSVDVAMQRQERVHVVTAIYRRSLVVTTVPWIKSRTLIVFSFLVFLSR